MPYFYLHFSNLTQNITSIVWRADYVTEYDLYNAYYRPYM